MHLLSLFLAALLALLQVGDWLTTRANLLSGKAREANPIIAAMIARLGVDGALILKGLFVVAITFPLALGIVPVPPLTVALLLTILVALYVWVVSHNLGVLRQ